MTTQTLKIDGKLAVRAGKLTKHGMGILNRCKEYGGYGDPLTVQSVTGIDSELIAEFFNR